VSAITARVVGGNDLKRELDRLKRNVPEAAQAAMQASAEAIRDDVRAHIRKDTGNLANTIEMEIDAQGRGGFGALRGTGKNAWVGWKSPEAYYARFNEYGTQHRPADPALTSAAERERAEFVTRVRAAVTAVLPR
jgi:HK97 gp10 family phage protein